MSSRLRLFSVLLVGLLLASGCASVQLRAADSSQSQPMEKRVDKASAEQPEGSRVTKPLCFGCPKEGPPFEPSSPRADSNFFALDTALRGHSGLSRCLATVAAEGADLEPRPILELRLTPAGHVQSAALVGSEWSGTSLDQCVTGKLNGVDLGVAFSGRTKDVRVRWRVTSPTH